MKAALDAWKSANAGKLRKWLARKKIEKGIEQTSDEITSLGPAIANYE